MENTDNNSGHSYCIVFGVSGNADRMGGIM